MAWNRWNGLCRAAAPRPANDVFARPLPPAPPRGTRALARRSTSIRAAGARARAAGLA